MKIFKVLFGHGKEPRAIDVGVSKYGGGLHRVDVDEPFLHVLHGPALANRIAAIAAAFLSR